MWDKLQVQMIAKDIGDDANRVEISQTGDTVSVKYKSHKEWWGSNRDLRFDFCVPANFNLELSTSGGDISTNGKLTGDVRLSTSGGDLKIEDVDGTVDGRTSGGDIVVQGLRKDATLSTSGGDISVDHAGSNLVVSTSGGDITVGNVEKNLYASTSGGDVSVKKVGGTIHATTSSGDMTIGTIGGSVSLSTSGGDISLSSGNGRIIASTSGGDVNVEIARGSVDVTSAGGTIKVGLIPNGNEESKVESSGGDLYLYVPADAKANIKAEIIGGDDDEIINGLTGVTSKLSNGSGNKEADFTLNGGGQQIYLHTSGGNIHVDRLNSTSK